MTLIYTLYKSGITVTSFTEPKKHRYRFSEDNLPPERAWQPCGRAGHTSNTATVIYTGQTIWHYATLQTQPPSYTLVKLYGTMPRRRLNFPPTQLDMMCRPVDRQWNTFQAGTWSSQPMSSVGMRNQLDTACSLWRCRLSSSRRRKACSENHRWRDIPSQQDRKCRHHCRKRRRIQLSKGTQWHLWLRGSNSQHYRVCTMTDCPLNKNLARKKININNKHSTKKYSFKQVFSRYIRYQIGNVSCFLGLK